MPALRRTAVSLLLAASALVPTSASASDLSSPVPAASTLDRQVAQQQADLAAQARRLQDAERAAGQALEARQAAERAASLAERQAREEAVRLQAATVAVTEAQDGLDDFAAALYRGGPSLSYVTAAIVTDDPAGLLHDVQVAQQVGDVKAQDYTAFQVAEAAQRQAVQRSRAASARAFVLRQQARSAQARADAAAADQSALVQEQQGRLADLVDAAAAAHLREERLAQAEQLALLRSNAGIPVSALAGALVPRPTALCAGGDLKGFPNGQLPESALCPLWGTAGQVLRADAAAAFDEMSHAYAAETGEPLCVTDSYRNYAEQVAVRAAKPTLAAVPGSSNHGWGVALDLCGGVQQFDSPAHRWMKANAAASGWFHPAWAAQGGSKPEPWHWEFAG